MYRTLLLSILVGLLCPVSLLASPTYQDPIYGYSVTSNITYGTGATNNGGSTTALKLDLYRPADIGQGVPSNNPALVLIHGGGFTSGSKSDLEMAAAMFASYGYTVASINYRLAGSNPPPEPGPGGNLVPPAPPYATLPVPQGFNAVNAAVNDATKAMQWMHDNASSYGFDPQRIGIGGASAGAVTALLLAYNDPAPEVTPKVVLSYVGSMYDSQYTIQPGDAPAFIVAGELDDTVPPSGSVDLANRLNDLGIANQLFVQPGVGHDVDFFKLYDGQPLLNYQINFLATYLVPEPSGLLLTALALGSLVTTYTLRSRRPRC